MDVEDQHHEVNRESNELKNDQKSFRMVIHIGDGFGNRIFDETSFFVPFPTVKGGVQHRRGKQVLSCYRLKGWSRGRNDTLAKRAFLCR